MYNGLDISKWYSYVHSSNTKYENFIGNKSQQIQQAT